MENKMIDEKIVSYIANLSRLKLEKKDVGKFSKQLNSVLDYINKLNEIDTKNIEPTSHALSGLKNVYRDDAVKRSLTQDEALGNAPKKTNNLFVVPKVIE